MSEENPTGKEIIDGGSPAPCETCERFFGRIQHTWRYCHECGGAYCEGQHGLWVPSKKPGKGKGRFLCLVHATPYQERI